MLQNLSFNNDSLITKAVINFLSDGQLYGIFEFFHTCSLEGCKNVTLALV